MVTAFTSTYPTQVFQCKFGTKQVTERMETSIPIPYNLNESLNLSQEATKSKNDV